MIFLEKLFFVTNSSVKQLRFIGLFVIFATFSGCDLFKVSVCSFQDFDDDGTACPAELGINDGTTGGMTPRTTDTPLGPLRKFEERAKITNDANQKFVGIFQNEYAISLLTAPAVSFSAVQFHLDRPQEQMQLEEVTCKKCPLPTSINAKDDSVYLTNEAAPAFWLLRAVMGADDESHLIKANGDLSKIDNNLNLASSRRPFFHPTLDASLIPTKSPLLHSSDSLRLTVGTTPFVSTHDVKGSITAAMIGDIDATDPIANGVEVVRFADAAVVSVYHYDPVKMTQSVDTLLAEKLNNEVQKRMPGFLSGIGAAYVNDLNGDGFLDFIFSLGADIFVSSYKGKNSISGLPVFGSWPKKVLSVPADEKIQSIMAIDITNDGYPELIVVTNKFVHFYLNTPK